MDKTLIAFFSLKGETYVNGNIENRPVGNTEVIARKIQAQAGGDLFHIETVTPYPTDYYKTTGVAKDELLGNARPALKPQTVDVSQYGTIVLGYPNWWGTAPMAVFSFLANNDFSGKRIIPYCTHEGSGLARSVQDIRKVCPQAHVLEGTPIRGGGVAHADREVGRIVELLNRQ